MSDTILWVNCTTHVISVTEDDDGLFVVTHYPGGSSLFTRDVYLSSRMNDDQKTFWRDAIGTDITFVKVYGSSPAEITKRLKGT